MEKENENIKYCKCGKKITVDSLLCSDCMEDINREISEFEKQIEM